MPFLGDVQLGSRRGFVRPGESVRVAAADAQVDTPRFLATTVSVMGRTAGGPPAEVRLNQFDQVAVFMALCFLDGDGRAGGWVRASDVIDLFSQNFGFAPIQIRDVLNRLIRQRFLEFESDVDVRRGKA